MLEWMQKARLRVNTGHRQPKVIMSGATLLLLAATMAGLFYWRRADFAQFSWHLRWEYLILTAVMFVLALLLVVWLWARLMRALGLDLPLTTHLRYFGLANIAKRLPGTIWYIAGRAYLYKQLGVSAAVIAVASGVEMIVLTLASAVVSLVFAGAAFITYLNANAYILPLVLASLAASLVMVHPRMVGFILKKITHQETRSLPPYGFMLIQVVLSVGVWLAGGVMFYGFCAALAEITLEHLPYVIGVWALSSLLSSFLFFLPSNLGVKEVSSAVLLAAIMPFPAAILSVLISRVTIMVYEAIWALIGVWSEKQSNGTFTQPTHATSKSTADAAKTSQ